MCSLAYMENCLSLASMLRCLIHILVNADPMSLVPPERHKKEKIYYLKKVHIIFTKTICSSIKPKLRYESASLQLNGRGQDIQKTLVVVRLST